MHRPSYSAAECSWGRPAMHGREQSKACVHIAAPMMCASTAGLFAKGWVSWAGLPGVCRGRLLCSTCCHVRPNNFHCRRPDACVSAEKTNLQMLEGSSPTPAVLPYYSSVLVNTRILF